MTRAAPAFTLVEMMVALAVTGILTVLMLQMFSDSSTIWKTEDDRLDTFREARAALEMMTRDFATTLPLPHATTAAAVEQFPVLALQERATARPVTDPAGLATTFFRRAHVLAAAPNAGRGDLCSVGYYLEWEPDIRPADEGGAAATPAPRRSNRNAFALRRQVASSDTTFERLRTTLSATTPLFGDAAFRLLHGPQPGEAMSPGVAVDTIASYIWDLQFTAAPIPPITPAPIPAPASTPGRNGFYGTELPAWIEIRFKALGSTAVRKLGGQAISATTWETPDDPLYRRLILPAEQQFISRVKLAR